MRIVARSLLLVLVLACLSTCQAFSQTIVDSFPFEGIQRAYRVYVPPSYAPGTPAPLVFNLHGYTSNAQQQEFYSEMNAVADTAGFIVVYPDGVNNAWNAGFGLTNTNDVGFISVLIDTMNANYNIDLTRVYSCGMSNGGFMSFHLACQLDNRIAAIASVTGLFATGSANSCSASRPVPIMQIHGTMDGVVPYGGSTGMLSLDGTLNWWRAHNACTAPPIYDTLPDLVNEGSTITTQRYGGCQDNVEVLHYKVANGSHSWPGALPVVPGITNQDVEASVEIWRFFRRFSHPAPILVSTTEAVTETFPSFFPQPATHKLRLTPSNFAYKVELIDLQGKPLGQWHVAAHAAWEVDVADWPRGLYLARFSGPKGDEARKLMLQ